MGTEPRKRQRGVVGSSRREVRPLSGYRLHVEFDDGVKGEVDLSEQLVGPVFEPLKDPDFFAQVSIDEFGVICWPNDADVAPDALYRRLQGQGGAPAPKPVSPAPEA